MFWRFVGYGRDDLYPELWKACAGPLVDVPRTGERVFYLPQGHMEQVSQLFLQIQIALIVRIRYF